MLKIVFKVKMLVWSVLNWITLRRKKARWTSFPQIKGIIRCHGKGRMKFGEHVRINSSYSSNPIGGSEKTILTAALPSSEISIGNHVGISNSTIIARDRVTIEDNVLIGGDCRIYDNDFHSLDYDERMGNKIEKIKSSPVLIQEGAFIGAHSIILKGSIIGRHSIIGAGSVVSGRIPPNEIWGGAPARFIKRIEE